MVIRRLVFIIKFFEFMLGDLLAGTRRPKKKDDGDMVDSGRSWRRYITTLTVDYIFVILPILSTLTVRPPGI